MLTISKLLIPVSILLSSENSHANALLLSNISYEIKRASEKDEEKTDNLRQEMNNKLSADSDACELLNEALEEAGYDGDFKNYGTPRAGEFLNPMHEGVEVEEDSNESTTNLLQDVFERATNSYENLKSSDRKLAVALHMSIAIAMKQGANAATGGASSAIAGAIGVAVNAIEIQSKIATENDYITSSEFVKDIVEKMAVSPVLNELNLDGEIVDALAGALKDVALVDIFNTVFSSLSDLVDVDFRALAAKVVGASKQKAQEAAIFVITSPRIAKKAASGFLAKRGKKV